MTRKNNDWRTLSSPGGDCPRCGRHLINRINPDTHKSIIGCSGYPTCKYEEWVKEDHIDFAGESFPNGWQPNFSFDLFPLIKKCILRPEAKYLFGAAYYLDHKSGLSENPVGMTLYGTDIVYDWKQYEAIGFPDPSQYWGGGPAPFAMAFVPQLDVGDRYQHDFGIFFAENHSSSAMDWCIGIAVEVEYDPGKSKYREAYVKYPVLKLKPENDDPLTWFKKVKDYWEGRVEN